MVSSDSLCALPEDRLAFLLFEVAHPASFDAVLLDEAGGVREIQVKAECPGWPWVWRAFRMLGHVLHALHALWLRRNRQDAYFGTLVNAWIKEGGQAVGVRAGTHDVDTGTIGGYREALRLLTGEDLAMRELQVIKPRPFAHPDRIET